MTENEFKSIEAKWRGKWAESKVFEPEPDGRKPFYLTVAYPYPSGGMHIGHARTYTVPDVIARFKRMQGYNTLFPMGWHVTGTPIIGAVNRLKEGEEKQLHVLRDVYGIKDDELHKLDEPMKFARYFIENHYLAGMRGLGYTIDWRRQFTTNDPHYNKFVEWQYKGLKSKGLLKQGLHPVKYCTVDENPVTTHDLLEGEDAEIQEFTLLKFEFGGKFLIAATLRPETVFGQTNMWVGPDVAYVEADVDGETWIVSRECAGKLGYQDHKVEVKKEFYGSELIGKYCKAPGIDREIIILPSLFCDPGIATGLVTSVPSDAPFDYMGLKDLQENEEMCREYNLDCGKVKALNIIPIINTPRWGDDAAVKICKEFGVTSQKDFEKLGEATKEVYKEGFHKGVLNENCGKYSGMKIVDAKDMVKQDLIDAGKASTLLEFSKTVTCRCGGNVVVAKKESWFIDYANPEWKELARESARRLNAIPEGTRDEYLKTIDWLHEWPCIRNFGLGTKLPFDDKFVIEPLSDSTIYMAFYTISHLVKELDVKALTPHFFDYVFRGEGTVEEVSKETGVPTEKLVEIRDSFDYWYPQNWRCSALELIQNHLTFMLFHHVALFPKEKWPQGIASFGMGLLEGNKMSSSKGNVVLVRDAVGKHGADVVRLFLMANAEPWQDFDWRENLVVAAEKKLTQFKRLFEDARQIKEDGELESIDFWMLSRLNQHLKTANECLENFETRRALQSVFYGLLKDWNWYARRTEPKRQVAEKVFEKWVCALTPFTPYT
ncbi:MAG TPA: leucine--tRNA ligase, partial [Candidatus Altiarchaeales archaeon]|nr:leucine--tRNA ligase [Candidatus Altiarchaeales archaeon]